jgi:hypothetical protein
MAGRSHAQHLYQAAARFAFFVQVDRRRQFVGERPGLTETYTPRLNTTAQIALDGLPPIPIQDDRAKGAGYDTHPASHAKVTIHDHRTGIFIA